MFDIIITGLLDQHDLLIACIDAGNVEQMIEFYYNDSICIMPPNLNRLGWCAQSILFIYSFNFI